MIAEQASPWWKKTFSLKDKDLINRGEIVINILDYSLIKLSYSNEYLLHNDLGLLLTTSGSTGSPKLVKLTYENIYANAESISDYLSIDENERPSGCLMVSNIISRT